MADVYDVVIVGGGRRVLAGPSVRAMPQARNPV